MEELMLNSEVMKQTLKDKGVHTPAIFVEKSKYFYMHEMKLSGEDIHKSKCSSSGTNINWTPTYNRIG